MSDVRRKDNLLAQAAPPDASILLLGRVLLLASALLSTAAYTLWNIGQRAELISFLYIPIGFLFGFSALSALWLKVRGSNSIFIWSQMLVDALMVTGVVYVTGSSISPFIFLYLPIVLGAAIFLSRQGGLILATLCAALYGGLLFSIGQGWLLSADGTAAVFQPPGGLALQVMSLWVAMALTAFGASFLVKKLRSSYQLVEQSRADIKQREEALIESMPTAVVTALLDDTIQNLNSAAKDMLQISGGTLRGRKIPEVLKELDSDCSIPEGKQGSHAAEVSFGQGENKKRVRIICQQGNLPGDQQQRVGKVYILEDVTKLRSVEEQLELQEKMARLLSGTTTNPELSTPSLESFIGESPVMRKVFSLIRKVGPSDATILINGESGTGKELVARAIHESGERRSGPFVAVNCGAIPETLIESELFGHVKGSFTGAHVGHIGLFQQANGGTLFLDEVGELPQAMQAKLLRALQERAVRPVGSEGDVAVDVRVLAATNRQLKDEVAVGTFREDLYYRLNVISINLPPLRERKDDIPVLVNFLLRKISKGQKVPFVSPEAMRRLVAYSYPGNVRELENVLERAHVLGGDVILPDHLPETVQQTAELVPVAKAAFETQVIVDDSIEFPVSLDQVLARVEKHYLEVALVKTNGAKKKAADLLGINFRSFRYRLQKFGISDDAE